MTLHEAIKKYIEYYKLHENFGDNSDAAYDSIAPLLPFCVMDAAYQCYSKYLSQLQLKHELKYNRNLIKTGFERFQLRLMRVYTSREYDTLTDLFDRMESDLSHDLLITHVKSMDIFAQNHTLDEQNVLATVLMINQLGLIAQRFWGCTYRQAVAVMKGGYIASKPKECKEIYDIMLAARAFAKKYTKDDNTYDAEVTDKKVDALDDALTALVYRIVRWMTKVNKHKRYQ